MAPSSFNPRSTLDANGQRILSLVFSALIRIDLNLEPIPDQAQSWSTVSLTDGKVKWVFRLKDSLVDHKLQKITARDWVECLDNYRVGKPTSALIGSFPQWIETREGPDGTVELITRGFDPYLPRNLSALKFFRVPGESKACAEPSNRGDSELVTSGRYRFERWPKQLEDPLTLLPWGNEHAPNAPPLVFNWVVDDHARLLKILRGDVDASLTTLSLTKTEWLRKNHASHLNFVDRDSTRINYVAFNQRHPLLKDRRVRQALALAIPREAVARYKLLGYATLVSSLLAPELPEAVRLDYPYDLSKARALLAEAQVPHLKLRYKTTPVREGIEFAQILQNEWKKIGVSLELDVVEPAVFLQAARKGEFEVYSSRWLGVADGSILYRTLRSGLPDNRVGYSNPEVDRWLDEASHEPKLERRQSLLGQVQRQMLTDLPYFPLWTYRSTLITSPRLLPLTPNSISLSGSFETLVHLRWKNL